MGMGKIFHVSPWTRIACPSRPRAPAAPRELSPQPAVDRDAEPTQLLLPRRLLLGRACGDAYVRDVWRELQRHRGLERHYIS